MMDVIQITVFLLSCLCTLCYTQNYTYKTQWIDMPLDHFSFINNNTFKLRYLVNNDNWDVENGPIFFYTGNEGDITMFADNTGFMWDIASEFNASLIFAEHRYYGLSLPFGNNSFNSSQTLGYLSSTQALADYVYLINYLQKQQTRRHPIVAFGGSYGGMLAAWLRIKYPYVIDGAISSSAPIFQFGNLTPCKIFSLLVTSSFRSSCKNDSTKLIRKSWKTIRNITSESEGRTWFSKEWNLCELVKTNEDADMLINRLVDMYGMIAMLNYPYQTNFVLPLPAYPVREVCSKLQNLSLTGRPLLSALYRAISFYINSSGECFNFKNDPAGKLGEAGWDFQSCTEMIMPMCSNGIDDMFEKSPWDLQSFQKKCQKQFGVFGQEDTPILEYGGKYLKHASNIVFSNGLEDPWAGGGVLTNASSSVVAVLIPDAAHHLDLRASNPADPSSVIQTRNFYRTVIKKWIQQKL